MFDSGGAFKGEIYAGIDWSVSIFRMPASIRISTN